MPKQEKLRGIVSPNVSTMPFQIRACSPPNPRKVGIIVEEKYSVGNRVWIDDGRGGGIANDGIINGSEVGIDGVDVQLFQDTTNNGVPDTLVETDTTHQGGYYIFD